MIKSQKFQKMISGCGGQMEAHLRQNKERYAKAWCEITEEGVDSYVFNAGYEGMPADYIRSFATSDELYQEMKSFVDFRSWNFTDW